MDNSNRENSKVEEPTQTGRVTPEEIKALLDQKEDKKESFLHTLIYLFSKRSEGFSRK